MVLLMAGSAAFVAAGIWIIGKPGTPFDRFMGWSGLVFFGLCFLVAVIQILPGASFLRLEAEGFTVCSMWRTTFYRWSDIESFGVAEFTIAAPVPTRHRMVGFNFSPSYPRAAKSPGLKRFNRSLTGYEAALPDNYGWKHDMLAARLNQWREEARRA